MSEPLLDEVDKTKRLKNMKWPKARVSVKGCCPGCPSPEQPWIMAIAILALVIVILSITTVAISLFRSSDADSVIRISIEASPSRVIPGPGEGNYSMTGILELNSKTFSLSYTFYLPPGLSQVQSLLVRGPIPIGALSSTTIAFALCGNPNLVQVCDVFTTPGLLKDTIYQIEPGATAVLPQIGNIRSDPTRYYLEVLTSDYPTSPGALRGPFYSIIGTSL
jgi:hypothetical protein